MIALVCYILLLSSVIYAPSQADVQSLGASSGIAADVSFDFVDGLEGWGEATTREMRGEVYHRSGELRMKVTGAEPHIDSPRMRIPIEQRQSLVMRYRMVGKGKQGKARLSKILNMTDHGFTTWGEHGNSNHEEFLDVDFAVRGDGLWHTTYATFPSPRDSSIGHVLTQMRVWPAILASEGNSFHIDWIRLVQGPIIKRVTGCSGEKYSNSSLFKSESYEITPVRTRINGVLETIRTVWNHRESNLPYGQSYNCLRSGGEAIVLEGESFGGGGVGGYGSQAHVFIDGRACTRVVHDQERPQQILTCITPSLSEELDADFMPIPVRVEIRNGKLPGLLDAVPFFSYARAPPTPRNISVSNVASRSVDISWQPGGSVWDHMALTGYMLRWREDSSSSWEYSMAVGNVTITTIRNLAPNRLYRFAVSSLNEDQNNAQWWKELDLYGGRDVLEGAVEGPIATITCHTLSYDVSFVAFDANSTQNHGPIDERGMVGPTGVSTGEGHYGLVLQGDASIENCNASSYCCDEYDPELGCRQGAFTCRVTAYQHEESDLPGSGKIIEMLNESALANFESRCGQALRLTGATAQLRGSAWYPRQLEVGEGFDSTFTFRLSNPSVRCNNMDDVHTRCRSRGADGLAFVLQADRLNALGEGGSNLGYGGMNNSLAVELDTFFNYENLEPYENHISVQTRGWRHQNSANHTYGHTNSNVPDLTNGEIKMRILYLPRFSIDAVVKPAFMASPYASHFFENGLADGLGMLYVYCQDLVEPVLIVPLNLAATLNLDRGRAWVGFTAATGDETWQAHDVLDWRFSSLRQDQENAAPTVINGEGAHACSGGVECVHL